MMTKMEHGSTKLSLDLNEGAWHALLCSYHYYTRVRQQLPYILLYCSNRRIVYVHVQMPCNHSVREQNRRSNESAIVISASVNFFLQRYLQASTKCLQHSIWESESKPRKQKIERYIDQFFHCSAVKVALESICVGIRPRFGGRITISIRSWITSIAFLSSRPCLI